MTVTKDGLAPPPGADIDVIGPAMITPAVLDRAGNEVTPAALDKRYHVNLRIDPDALPGWIDLRDKWRAGRSEKSNKSEVAVKFRGVALITGGIKTPQRIWAGDRQ